MRKNEKDLEFVVYEPVKRLNDDSIISKNELKITKKYSGLLNRGIIYTNFHSTKFYLLKNILLFFM